jgi:Retrotransposon gag protein
MKTFDAMEHENGFNQNLTVKTIVSLQAKYTFAEKAKNDAHAVFDYGKSNHNHGDFKHVNNMPDLSATDAVPAKILADCIAIKENFSEQMLEREQAKLALQDDDGLDKAIHDYMLNILDSARSWLTSVILEMEKSLTGEKIPIKYEEEVIDLCDTPKHDNAQYNMLQMPQAPTKTIKLEEPVKRILNFYDPLLDAGGAAGAGPSNSMKIKLPARNPAAVDKCPTVPGTVPVAKAPEADSTVNIRKDFTALAKQVAKNGADMRETIKDNKTLVTAQFKNVEGKIDDVRDVFKAELKAELGKYQTTLEGMFARCYPAAIGRNDINRDDDHEPRHEPEERINEREHERRNDDGREYNRDVDRQPARRAPDYDRAISPRGDDDRDGRRDRPFEEAPRDGENRRYYGDDDNGNGDRHEGKHPEPPQSTVEHYTADSNELPASFKCKPPIFPKFATGSNLDGHFSQLERYFRLSQIPSFAQVDFALLSLPQYADWWDAWYTTRDESIPVTWTAFKETMKSFIMGQSPAQTAMSRLLNLKQGTFSAEKYAKMFLSLVRQSNTVPTENWLVHHFLMNLTDVPMRRLLTANKGTAWTNLTTLIQHMSDLLSFEVNDKPQRAQHVFNPTVQRPANRMHRPAQTGFKAMKYVDRKAPFGNKSAGPRAGGRAGQFRPRDDRRSNDDRRGNQQAARPQVNAMRSNYAANHCAFCKMVGKAPHVCNTHTDANCTLKERATKEQRDTKRARY